MGIQLVKDLLNSSVKADNTNGASAESESLFWFYLCDSEEQLKAHVASEKAECGYVVPEDLGERLRNKKDKKHNNIVYIPIYSNRLPFYRKHICSTGKTV